jgi:hypothetical protein
MERPPFESRRNKETDPIVDNRPVFRLGLEKLIFRVKDLSSLWARGLGGHGLETDAFSRWQLSIFLCVEQTAWSSPR